jgi:hypothetical protein
MHLYVNGNNFFVQSYTEKKRIISSEKVKIVVHQKSRSSSKPHSAVVEDHGLQLFYLDCYPEKMPFRLNRSGVPPEHEAAPV